MTTERKLGNNGLRTPPLILGGNVFCGLSIRGFLPHPRCLCRGRGRMIDTADVYSAWKPGNQGGESETIIGEWLAARGRRDDVLIATKVGMEVGGSKGLASCRGLSRVPRHRLQRLRTDHIDLHFAHRMTPTRRWRRRSKPSTSSSKSGKVRTSARRTTKPHDSNRP